MHAQAHAAEKHTMEMKDMARKLGEADVFEGLRGARMGDPEGFKKAAAGLGWKIDGDVSVEPVVIDHPQLGKVKTYQASFNVKEGDKTTPMKVDALSTSMAAMDFEKQGDMTRKDKDTETRAQAAEDRANVARERLELQAKLNESLIALRKAQEAKAGRTGGSGGSGGGSGASERAERTQVRATLSSLISNYNTEIRDIDSQIKAATPQFQAPGAPPPTK